MPTRRRALLILAALTGLAVASIALALMVGSINIPIRDLIPALFGSEQTMSVEVIRSLRLPRALAGFACGGLLALAGALLQVLLRNPLADPYVLGISGGAGVGAILAILLGFGAAGVNGLAYCVELELGTLVQDLSGYYGIGGVSPVLGKITFGYNTNIPLDLSKWSPTSVLADNNQKSEMVTNIYTGISLRVKDNAGLTAKTITFSSGIREAIRGSAAESTLVAKNWNISPA